MYDHYSIFDSLNHKINFINKEKIDDYFFIFANYLVIFVMEKTL